MERLNRRQMLAAVAAGAIVAAERPVAAQGSEGVAQPPFPPGKIPVAFLMDEASTMMDFAGPWEVFQDVAMANAPGYFLYTVAPRMGVFNTTGTLVMDGANHGMRGLRFTPDYTVQNAPQPRVIVMGAQMNFAGPEKIEWLRRAAPGAEIVLSVCTGNFIAANAGLLDGKRATTHHRFFDRFAREFPQVQLVRDRRVVDNGKFISAGGITAGIDGALHIVRRHFGEEVTRRTMDYMEYRGDPGSGAAT